MIEGAVNENLEATIRLTLLGADREGREVEAIIDTGFTGYLTLPTALIRRLDLSWKGRGQALIADGSLHVFDEYIGTVLWNGQDRPVEVAAADTTPLVGMGLLKRHSLRVEVVARGEVRIEQARRCTWAGQASSQASGKTCGACRQPRRLNGHVPGIYLECSQYVAFFEIDGELTMLKRIHIKGYKSLQDVEVDLCPLVVLFGPNAAGKSNLLDALQLLSKLGTSRTLKEAFDPPYRGKPLESFTIGSKGIKGLLEQDRLSFSIEADLSLSDAVVEAVNRQIREMRRPHGEVGSEGEAKAPARVRERDLRYRIEVEMLPRSGILRVADEYLAALNRKGEPTGKRKPFLERQGTRIHLRHEGQAHPTYFDRYLDHSILSMPHYPPHYPHLVAARHELESWLFFYFEPRERMRAANPVKEVRHIGLMGEELAAFLNTMKATDARRFRGVEKALHTLMPNIDGIEVEVSDVGEVELRLKEGGVAIPARVLSEGTLRMLGLLALSGVDQGPALVGFEEPENGVHPRRIELIAELLRTQESLNQIQHIITTHSPILPDLLEDESLFAVRRLNGQTHIDPFSTWGPLKRREDIRQAFSDEEERLPVSARIMRGDFDA